MPKNTKEKSQWCRNGRWMPRKTPTCVEDPTSQQKSKSYAYGRSQRSRLNPDIAEMMRLFGDEFLIDPITETGTCNELPPIQTVFTGVMTIKMTNQCVPCFVKQVAFHNFKILKS